MSKKKSFADKNETQLPQAILEMPIAIADACFSVHTAVQICVDVKTNECCINVKLLGQKVAEGCLGWTISGTVGTVSQTFPTLNVGVWKLSSPRIDVKQDFESGDGSVLFSATLYQLTFGGYKKRKEWTDEIIGNW